MPRKTDGVLFELQPRPTKGEDGKPLLIMSPPAADSKGTGLIPVAKALFPCIQRSFPLFPTS